MCTSKTLPCALSLDDPCMPTASNALLSSLHVPSASYFRLLSLLRLSHPRLSLSVLHSRCNFLLPSSPLLHPCLNLLRSSPTPFLHPSPQPPSFLIHVSPSSFSSASFFSHPPYLIPSSPTLLHHSLNLLLPSPTLLLRSLPHLLPSSAVLSLPISLTHTSSPAPSLPLQRTQPSFPCGCEG